MPFGGRSTAIKLENGDVWLVASTPLSPETKTTLNAMGPVKYIVSPDVEHHFFLAEYKKAYPEAKVIGVEPLVAKKKGVLKIDGAYGKDPEGTTYGFESEITALYFAGFQNKDVVFLHHPTRTLITADLIFNLPGKEAYSKSKSSSKVPIFGSFEPFGKIHKHFLWGTGTDKVAMARDATTVAGWDFDRIIMCHGDVIETGGNKAWREAYTWYIDGKK